MNKFRLGLLALLVLGGSLALGAPAPAFSLPSDGKSVVCLDSLRGKVVYLDFWASWCDPCRKSFPWMEELQKRFGEQGLVVVAVNVDRKREAANRFLEKHPVQFTVGFDSEGVTPKLYDVKGLPTSFLISRSGEIVSTHTGFREKDVEELEKNILEELKK